MLLARLKRETLQLHREIERSLDLFRIDFSLDDYRCLLRRFYGYYAPWEDRAGTVAPELLEGRGKSDWLARDLIHLGLPRDELFRLERCPSVPAMDGAADVLGSLYVLEGATLGGQILHRHIRAHFGMNGRGCEFFTGYGERTGSMWKQFGAVMESQPAGDHERIVRSAVATFESMRAWLNGAGLDGMGEA